MSSFYIRNFKALTSFCGCAGRFVSYLVGNPEDRFSRDEAQLFSNSTTACCFLRYIIDYWLSWASSWKNLSSGFRPGKTLGHLDVIEESFSSFTFSSILSSSFLHLYKSSSTHLYLINLIGLLQKCLHVFILVYPCYFQKRIVILPSSSSSLFIFSFSLSLPLHI